MEDCCYFTERNNVCFHHSSIISTESFERFYKQYLHMSGRTTDDLGAQIYLEG